MNIIIFQKTGVTHKFEQVEYLFCSNGVVSFRYFGLSTQTSRFAVFHDIGGYSIEYEGESENIKLRSDHRMSYGPNQR